MEKEYVLGSQQDLAREQLDILSKLWDGYSARAFDDIDVRAGQRCLDIGIGAGSSTRMLAERVGPTGSVTAIDIDPTHYTDIPGVRFLEHDINNGVPDGGPFDVIHVRLVLMHLTRRAEILRDLTAALAPGGWLVVADNGHLPRIIAAPEKEDVDVFDRFQEMALANANRLGLSFEWANEIDRHMADSGLVNVNGIHLTHSGCGGSLEAKLSHNYVRQMEASLLQAGIPEGDVKRYRDLWLDPQSRFWFYDYACWAGQKP